MVIFLCRGKPEDALCYLVCAIPVFGSLLGRGGKWLKSAGADLQKYLDDIAGSRVERELGGAGHLNDVEDILSAAKGRDDVDVPKGLDGSGGGLAIDDYVRVNEGGSASKVGDFTNLYGSTVDDILDRIPDKATLRELQPVTGGSTEGFEFKWTQDGQTYRVRVHNADPGAPSGSNAANGWIVRVQRGKQYYE